ncbi:MAG: biofilm regulation protein kinase SiaB [Gammaproteobacteria bacterium]
MKQINLYSLRERFIADHIIFCFNGPIFRSLIEEIGNALKQYLESTDTPTPAAMDVFSVYIELSQNIRHYAASQGYDDTQSVATVVVTGDDHGHYSVAAGNMVELADGRALLARIEALAALDKVQLKANFKAQLRRPRNSSMTGGAGLGLIQIARTSSQPLEARLDELDGNRAFFSLRAVI